MRIIIETTDGESRTTVIGRGEGGSGPRDVAVIDGPPTDGGPAPNTLRQMLGVQDGKQEDARANEPATGDATRAGGPPDWLRDVIDGGAATRG
ncbi:hypothetical protein [Methylibium rhizosphaerae]|uniref:hypothetical protein n=1 Tax=Methylibium rhizosphaerae TaxID=2570323 RepID=UPI00112AC73D|nr:hypothetical protein [Methylibium rhizosphaerae]